MAETRRDPHAVRAYERTRDEVAEHRVVADAEETLARAWIGELEDVRRSALGTVAALRISIRAALDDLREAQSTGGPHQTAHAHARLASLDAEQAVVFEHARALLSFAEIEIDRAGRAGAERSRRVQHELERLRAAWIRAFAD